jgi:hypothetical protein
VLGAWIAHNSGGSSSLSKAGLITPPLSLSLSLVSAQIQQLELR